MRCGRCGSEKTYVYSTFQVAEINDVIRYHACKPCGRKWRSLAVDLTHHDTRFSLDGVRGRNLFTGSRRYGTDLV